MIELDESHDPQLRSWLASANDPNTDFPIQNLPFGVFRSGVSKSSEFSGGVAIGDMVLDIAAASKAGLFSGAAASAAQAASHSNLNTLMALGRPAWRALRLAISHLLTEGNPKRDKVRACLVPMNKVELGMPAKVGNYTDFYASIYHATNVGRLFRPDNPLLPNYKYVPIAYHGRASSVRVSGTAVQRPRGQTAPAQATSGAAEAAPLPSVGPSKRLDYELELGFWIGPGNNLGRPIDIEDAEDHLFGVSLLNDWSARDLQAWEYQPLGPFLAKNFLTTVSPWIVTLEALAPFRAPLAARPASDPQPLGYLDHPRIRQYGAFDIQVEAWLDTEQMRRQGLPPHKLSSTSTRYLYWAPAQMITHHTMGGCNLESGDLLGSGTTSGPEPTGLGCLLEITRGGKDAVRLESGEQRTFLENGDQVILTAYCEKTEGEKTEGEKTDGDNTLARRIGFGHCAGTCTA